MQIPPPPDTITELLNRTDEAMREEAQKSSTLAALVQDLIDTQSRHREEQTAKLNIIVKKINSINSAIK